MTWTDASIMRTRGVAGRTDGATHHLTEAKQGVYHYYTVGRCLSFHMIEGHCNRPPCCGIWLEIVALWFTLPFYGSKLCYTWLRSSSSIFRQQKHAGF